MRLSKPCSVLDSFGPSQNRMASCSEQEKENYLAPYVVENFVVLCANVSTRLQLTEGMYAMAVIKYFGHNRYEAPGHTSSL
jgi:hypothetical protein